MEPVTLRLAALDPFVRYVHAFAIDRDTPFVDVVPYDCRCIVVNEGEGAMVIGGRRYPARAGSLFLWPAGVSYSYLPDRPFAVLGVNFDHTRAASAVATPVPPDKSAHFRPAGLLAPVTFADCPALNDVIALPQAHWAADALTAMEEEYRTGRRHAALRLKAQMLTLLADIIHQADEEGTAPSPSSAADAILSYLNRHYRQNLTNGDVAGVFHFTPAYVSRLVKRHTGLSLHQYLLRCRLTAALNLIQTTTLPIGHIARETGFADANYFARRFRQEWGRSPVAFRV